MSPPATKLLEFTSQLVTEHNFVHAQALSGRFMLNGEEVPLPVNESDSLAMKIEALRMFLEQQLDTMPFLRWVVVPLGLSVERLSSAKRNCRQSELVMSPWSELHEDWTTAKTITKVYRRLESLSVEDDEDEVSREFLEALGPEKLPYLQLIHQLIVCE
eukprot:scaffold1249_cov17-Tisochrysis_lutea.AAC.1